MRTRIASLANKIRDWQARTGDMVVLPDPIFP
jgi:hypothetical protein